MRLFEGTPLDRPPRCDQCGELEQACRCPPAAPTRIDPAKQTARIAVERRKKGKVVTIVRGLSPEGNDLVALLGTLKSLCGAGGTLKESELEVQGNHLERIREQLMAIGYRVH